MTLLWKPTLAATLPEDYDLTTLPYPLLGSPKLDGVRALVQRGVVVSRNGRPIPNRGVQRMYNSGEFDGMDGELTVGPPNAADVFNRTVSVVMSGGGGPEKEAEAERLCRFNVFDHIGRETSALLERQKFLQFCKPLPRVVVVKQTRLNSAAALERFEAKCLAAGYEGVMLRRLDAGPYMEKRSTLREFNLVKLKRFDYAEAVILEVYKLEHNKNTEKTATGRRSTKATGIVTDAEGRIGSALLRDKKSGVQFTVSVAGDALQRWPGWKVAAKWRGAKVRYKYQNVGSKNGVPRFPTCEFKELL